MTEPTHDAPATDTTEEPQTTGTLFLTFVLLVIIGAVWVIMYRLLLER